MKEQNCKDQISMPKCTPAHCIDVTVATIGRKKT